MYTSNERFQVDGGYFERVLPSASSNAHRDAGCWHPKPKLPPSATSNWLRSLHSIPPSMLLSYKWEIATRSGQSTKYVVFTSSANQCEPVDFLFQVGLHVSFSCVIAFSYPGRPYELTLVGATSSTCPISEPFAPIRGSFVFVGPSCTSVDITNLQIATHLESTGHVLWEVCGMRLYKCVAPTEPVVSLVKVVQGQQLQIFQ